MRIFRSIPNASAGTRPTANCSLTSPRITSKSLLLKRIRGAKPASAQSISSTCSPSAHRTPRGRWAAATTSSETSQFFSRRLAWVSSRMSRSIRLTLLAAISLSAMSSARFDSDVYARRLAAGPRGVVLPRIQRPHAAQPDGPRGDARSLPPACRSSRCRPAVSPSGCGRCGAGFDNGASSATGCSKISFSMKWA